MTVEEEGGLIAIESPPEVLLFGVRPARILATRVKREPRASGPDGAARQIKPGEIAQWVVVRIADEIVVDLMRSACGIDYPMAEPDIQVRDVDGVAIPFASPELLWRTKQSTRREKDIPDLLFLREWFKARCSSPE